MSQTVCQYVPRVAARWRASRYCPKQNSHIKTYCTFEGGIRNVCFLYENPQQKSPLNKNLVHYVHLSNLCASRPKKVAPQAQTQEEELE